MAWLLGARHPGEEFRATRGQHIKPPAKWLEMTLGTRSGRGARTMSAPRSARQRGFLRRQSRGNSLVTVERAGGRNMRARPGGGRGRSSRLILESASRKPATIARPIHHHRGCHHRSGEARRPAPAENDRANGPESAPQIPAAVHKNRSTLAWRLRRVGRQSEQFRSLLNQRTRGSVIERLCFTPSRLARVSSAPSVLPQQLGQLGEAPSSAAPRRTSADLVAERRDAAICPESGEKWKCAACA